MRGVVLALNVDPRDCLKAVDDPDAKVIRMATADQVADLLWQAKEDVGAVVMRVNEPEQDGLSDLLEILDRDWPQVRLVWTEQVLAGV